MKLTKYEHACLVLEEQGKKLVVDPGDMARGLGNLRDVVAVVATHSHSDHFSTAHIAEIAANNPGLQVFGTDEVAGELAKAGNALGAGIKIVAVHKGDALSAGPFSLAFFGEMHALIHGDMPKNQNVGVLINNNVYYPGDSFTLPGVAVQTLALPVSGPWLKIGESMDFLAAAKPKVCFPTHDIFLSEVGQASTNKSIERLCQEIGATYRALQPGQSFEV